MHQPRPIDPARHIHVIVVRDIPARHPTAGKGRSRRFADKRRPNRSTERVNVARGD